MFFMEDRFFKGLRLIIALDPNKVALGEVVLDIIQREVLPKLNTDKKRAKSDKEKESIQEEIDEWEIWGDRRTPEGRSWNTEAAKIVGSIGKTLFLTESQKEDVAQDIVSSFYGRDQKLLKKLALSTGGPEGMMSFFKRMIIDKTRDIVRAMRKTNIQKDRLIVPLETDERDLKDVLHKTETDLTKEELQSMRKDMKKWVKPKLSKQGRILFDMWWKEAEKVGPEKVNFSKIRPIWIKRSGATNLSDNWIRIKKQMAKYLKEVEGLDLSPRAKRKLKISEVIATNFIRRRFATWMLEIARARGVV